MSYEAVQFRDWRPWHAVRPNKDRTFCGISVFGAKHMWEKWEEQPFRCATCVKATRHPSTRQ